MMDNIAGISGASAEKTPFTWDFFQDLPAEREAFYKIAQRRHLKRKEHLFCEGDGVDSIFYIAEGEIILSRISSSGKEIFLYIHRKGVFVGLPASMVNMPLRSNAQSLTPCVIYETKINDFKSLITGYPVLNDRVMMQLYITITFMNSQYLSAFTDDADTRLKKLLARLFSEELLQNIYDNQKEPIDLNVTQDHLAASIGVSREMVNRILHRFIVDGLINVSAHKISFLKPAHFLSYLEMVPVSQ
jgi:CRP/FNR family transcriptional regulator, cyclic AMP receptor protein